MREMRRKLRQEMSEDQDRLLQRIMRRKITEINGHARIPRLQEGTGEVCLTSAQARVWFSVRLFPDSPDYNGFSALRFERCPEPKAFEAAIRVLMDRHDALRVRIVERDDEPRQVLCSDLAVPVTWYKLQLLSAEEAEREATEIGSRSTRQSFDLAIPPLFRVTVIHLPGGAALAIFVLHHIVVDGSSVGVLFQELADLLEGRPLPQAPPSRFIDYAAWQSDHVCETRIATQLDYWRQKLGGELPVLDLPKDRPRPAMPSRQGHTVPCDIDAGTVSLLKQLACAENATLFVVLLAAYKVLLQRLTGQSDVIVGAPFSGRNQLALENMVGMFVNTAALRTDLAGEPSFREVVRRVRTTVLEAQDNQDVPFEQVVAALKIRRDIQYGPVFQTMFGLSSAVGVLSENIVVSDVELDSETAKWDLTLSLNEDDGAILGFAEYSADIFEEKTAAGFVEMLIRLIARAAADPDETISKFRLISSEEKKRLLSGLNPYRRPTHPYTTLAQPFEEQVARTPNAVALVGDEGRMTYAALNAKANRLARHLRQLGVGCDDLVGVCMERCFDLVVALYAVSKSGAAYVPLDAELPAGRIAFMIEDTNPRLILVHAATRDTVSCAAPVLSVDTNRDDWALQPAENLTCSDVPQRLAYLLYTSGSTGRPKAVAHPINAAVAEIMWLHKRYPLSASDANIFKTSYGFDVSIWEIFWTLYFGAKLVVPRHGSHRDPFYLLALMRHHCVTTIFLIPGMLDVLLQAMTGGACGDLCRVFCGGAPVTPRLRDLFYANSRAQLINCYGPTEAGCVTDMVIPPDPNNPIVPLGRPAANYRVYVLDGELEPCPIGVSGEVYLAGEVALAHHYHRRPSITAEHFLPDPFGESGARMYRTGDLCRYRDDGVLEHLGRIGRQVKVRGMRIELAEIEALICEHESVERAVVLAHDNPELGLRIPAFVVPRSGAEIDVGELMGFARKLLPQHMLPACIVCVEAIPTNVNGKVDEPALLAYWHETAALEDREIVLPSGPDEEAMLAIFEDTLGVDEISVTDSFFDLGGHSLLIFKLISVCEAALGRRPSVLDVFTSSSVRDLCERINAPERMSGASLIPLTPCPGKPLLLFIHAASGSALPFLETARHLGSAFSCYGLQSPDHNEDAEPESIGDLAARYVAEVDLVRDLRPLIIAGWSMGGCVALEMARIWLGRDVDIAGLLMLDTWSPPTMMPTPDEKVRARQIIDELNVENHEVNASQDIELDTETRERLAMAFDRNREAFANYAARYLDVDLTYIRAEGDLPVASIDYPDMYRWQDRGWSSKLRSVEVRSVAGDHSSMLSGDNAPGLAAIISDVIDARLSYCDI